VRYLLIALAFALTGCAAQVTAAGGRTVVVDAGFPDPGLEKAIAMADAECQKRGLSARVQAITNPTSNKYVFECVRQ